MSLPQENIKVEDSTDDCILIEETVETIVIPDDETEEKNTRGCIFSKELLSFDRFKK